MSTMNDNVPVPQDTQKTDMIINNYFQNRAGTGGALN
jgi:hypothetical protein